MTLRSVSIIIPVYNMDKTISKAIDSVMRQNVDWHIIIVDDASVAPLQLPDEWKNDPRFQILRHLENLGAGAARNTGLQHAKTEWIAFLDADDQLMPDTLAPRLIFAQEQTIEKGYEPSKTLFGCGWLERDTQGQALFTRTPHSTDTAQDFASGCWWNPGSAMLFHRSAFDGDLKGYDQTLQRLEDFDFGLRFGLSGGRLVIDPTIGAQVQPGPRKNIQAIQSACKAIKKKHASLIQTNKAAWHNMSAYLNLELAVCFWRNGSYVKSLSHALRSLWYHPRPTLHLSPGWTFKKLER